MEMEMKDDLGTTVERLAAAAGLLEQVAERLSERQSAFGEEAEATIGRIVATVDGRREAELEQKLAAAEQKITELQAKSAELQAQSAGTTHEAGRKTLPTAMTNLLAKQGVTIDSLEAGALDAALVSLSLEQRIAVKAQLMRAGLLG
jgi:ABC-type Fe3+-citrate transport system substrate-binding protein